jgi:LmbE family N-acetylglucosaminyl deacetylase
MNIENNIDFPLQKGQQLVVIAPHHDDTILGAGHFILEAKKRGVLTTTTEVIVCCSRTNFFANYQANLLSEEQVTEVTYARIKEDILGCNALFDGWANWRQAIAGEWDAPLRLYTGRKTEGGGAWGDFSTFRTQEIDMFQRLVDRITPIVMSKNTTILALMANGKHIDHFTVREALLKSAWLAGDQAKAQIIFVEDQPYTAGKPEERDQEAHKLRIRVQDGLKTYTLPAPLNYMTDKTLMHEIFNAHYRTQWSESYERDLLKNRDFRFYVLDKSAYRKLSKDVSCQDHYCELTQY